MKARVLKMDKAMDDAVVQALVAIEAGRFNKTIKLLEYVKDNKQTYDIVMVEYALLISYVNTGQNDKASETLNRLEKLHIENDQIRQVIEQIKQEVLVTRKVKVNLKEKEVKKITTEDIFLELGLTKEKIENYRNKHLDDYVWSLMLAANDNIEDTKNELLHEFSECREAFYNVVQDLKDYNFRNSSVTPIMLFDQLNRFDKSVIFWGFMNSDVCKVTYNNDDLPVFIKKYLLERMVHFNHYGIINDFDIRYKGEVRPLSSFPDFSNNFFEVCNEIESFYMMDDTNLHETISSILNIVYINSYPKNIYEDRKKLQAIVGYIANDIFLGRNFDENVLKNTGYSFLDVQRDIQKLELLITFLVS